MTLQEFDKKREQDGIEVLELLRDIQAKCPYLRIGQIISNALYRLTGNDCDLFYAENDRLVKGLRDYLNNLQKQS